MLLFKNQEDASIDSKISYYFWYMWVKIDTYVV